METTPHDGPALIGAIIGLVILAFSVWVGWNSAPSSRDDD